MELRVSVLVFETDDECEEVKKIQFRLIVMSVN